MATPKQLLAEHLARHHKALPKGSGRWTMAQLARWHRSEHYPEGGAIGHTHAAPDTGPHALDRFVNEARREGHPDDHHRP